MDLWKTIRYYGPDSDFFVLVDLLADLCGKDDLELQYGNSLVASKIWRTVRIDLNQAAAYYSEFVNHVEILKQVTYANFLALLLATAVLVTLNSFLCVIDFSSDALGLLVFGAICAMECFFTCRLLDELDDVNEEIAMNAYSMDWMTSITLPRGNLDDYRSIRDTALIVQAQAQRGFCFRAGGMFDMNSKMFMQIMQMCYSWITFLMQTQKIQ
nr:uncharacterized protein LOC109433294 [Aedes albopictus]